MTYLAVTGRGLSRFKMDTGEGRVAHVSCLFPEILAMIFSYLEVRDKGRAAQVCRAWRDAAFHRLVWRGVEAKLHLRRANPSLFPSLVKRGIRKIQVLSLRRSLRELVQGVPNLEGLNLSGCYNVTDKGLLYAFQQELPCLTVLNLSLCKQISDSTLQWIARYLHNLEVLELGGCSNVTSNGLLMLSWGLRRLRVLNLRSCRSVNDQGIAHLAGLSEPPSLLFSKKAHGNLQLQHLVLQDCRNLSDQALKHISEGLHCLQSINLSFCPSVTDTGLRYLAKMPNLRELNLRSCDDISDTGIGFLAEGGSRVTGLDLSFCQRIGDQSLIHISQGLFHLRSLSLCACNISDDGICKLVRTAHDLSTLNIGQCGRITDKSLCQIADRVRNLKSIDLYGCTRISTVGLERIMQMSALTTLNLGLWHKR